MPKVGEQSLKRLDTCDERIQKVLNEVIKHYDFMILEGTRTVEQQQQYYKEGKSKLDGINKKSKHQSYPSLAVDIAPYPIDWNDSKRFYYLAGLVIATANSMGIKLRWGGDWDSDGDFKDNTFNDLPHFELV